MTNADDAPAFSLGLYARGPVTVDVLPGAEYGRLVLNGGTSPNYSYGIKVDKSLTVNDGTLYATGGEAPYNTGIYTSYNLTVHDGMVLASCKAATTLSYGINTYAYEAENEAYNGGLYMNGGTVYAQTTEAPTCIAINSNHNITITDGFVSATGGTAEKGSCGMAASLISLQGGEVVTTGGTCPDGSYGIIAGDIFRMDGGKLTAKAGETELGYGIAAQNGIEISSGTVTAQGIGGAMTHAPMADSYDHFSFWYGADEASAMAAGVKPGSLIPDYCGKHYVHFTDSAGGSDPSTPPEPHVHENTVDFTWSADLSAASAKATCTTCGEEQTAEADLTLDNATPGRLQLTAGITLDGMTYTAVQTITAARTGNTLTLHLPGLIFAEQIIVAGYNEDGQMTECQISKDYSLTMTFTVTAPEVRVFFLDSSFDPQTPAMIV